MKDSEPVGDMEDHSLKPWRSDASWRSSTEWSWTTGVTWYSLHMALYKAKAAVW